MEKVFCIGLNRTGTKSFAKAMRLLGRNPLPWSGQATKFYLKGMREELYDIIDRYDAFDDWPWPLMAKELMLAFPKARFVLTFRSSENAWLESLKRHAAKTPRGANFRKRIFGHAYPDLQQEEFLRFYRTFYADLHQIVEEVGCWDRVLSVCWESGDGWQELCDFLHLPIPSVEFPHLNASR